MRPSVSASANLAGRPSNRSLRAPTASVPGTTPLDKKPSPSPSIKRGKAERLLKEHGSPPGLRVTAGGRIVPSDLAPLGTTRAGDGFRSQALRVSPGNVTSTQPHPNHDNDRSARIAVIAGQPVVFVGDRMFALPSVDVSNPVMSSEAPSSADFGAKQNATLPNPVSHGSTMGKGLTEHTGSTMPSDAPDLPTLKAQQIFKKQELRTVEQTEVLEASHHPEAWRAGMIEKKRSLIVELDMLRKQIAALEANNAHNNTAMSFPDYTGTGTGSKPMAPFTSSSLQHSFPQAVYGYPTVGPYAPVMMYQPQSFASFPGYPTAEVTSTVPSVTVVHQSPASAGRRSHAIEIKPPPEATKKPSPSALDPKSPTYEPVFKRNGAQSDAHPHPPPTPSPSRPMHCQFTDRDQSDSKEHPKLSQKQSLSSIDTTDFFPTNTHEHSSTRIAPQSKEHDMHSIDTAVLPSTPEKDWPASPWNEGHSGRSRQNESAPKLTSWPEAFGKQPSLASLKTSLAPVATNDMHQRAHRPSGKKTGLAASDRSSVKAGLGQRMDTIENLPFFGRAVAHVPSTYQEGYQAGYDHVGMPDDPEVLQGYIQGLLHFLADESKKRRTNLSSCLQNASAATSNPSSLQGLVAGSVPLDSAISMTFDQRSLARHEHENIPSPEGMLLVNSRRDSAYSSNQSMNEHVAQCNSHVESDQELGQRNTSTGKHFLPTTARPEEFTAGMRPVSYVGIENAPHKGNVADAIQFANGRGTHQGFGEQLQNRGYSTSGTTQRLYPSVKDTEVLGLSENQSHAARLSAFHRMSGLDGAMDDLSEMLNDTEKGSQQSALVQSTTEAAAARDAEEVDASCFKSASGKGKQKAHSPSKTASSGREETKLPSENVANSPKKSGEHSPAKVKLEQVTNKFRRTKKDDSRAMSPEERVKRSDKWRTRFQQLKKLEMEEIEAHRRNS